MKSVTLGVLKLSTDKYELKLRPGLPSEEQEPLATSVASLGLNPDDARKVVLDTATKPALFVDVGEKLGAFLLSADVGREWKKLASAAQRQFNQWSTKVDAIRAKRKPTDEERTLAPNRPYLRTYLDLPKDDNLRCVPW